jgi:hypothetical protein
LNHVAVQVEYALVAAAHDLRIDRLIRRHVAALVRASRSHCV